MVRMIARAWSGKRGVPLTCTIAATRDGCCVAMCSSVLAPALMPIACTRSISESIQQREDVVRHLGEGEGPRWVCRSAMPAEVWRDDAESRERLGEDVLPVIAAAGEAVQQQQRLAGAAVPVKEVEAVDADRCVMTSIIATQTDEKQTGAIG